MSVGVTIPSMNNHQTMRLINLLIRGRGKSPWLTAILFVGIGYVFIAPALNQRMGWSLPIPGGGRGAAALGGADDGGYQGDYADLSIPTPIDLDSSHASREEQTIVNAFKNQKSNLIVTATFQVKRILPDDTDGSRHQKAIVTLPSGLSLLLAHNIDLAERVPMQRGDTIEVHGEYEYTEKGGVIHWTHHDPRGRHADGWIKHQGKTYQ